MRFRSLPLLSGLLKYGAILGVALLAACSGGDSTSTGTGTGTSTTNTSTTTTATNTTTTAGGNSLGITIASDVAAGSLAGNGNGLWDGAGGSDSGGGSDGGGGAGDGEFIQFNFKPSVASALSLPTATFTWKVLKSEYGIAGQTGTMVLTADPAGGGYSVQTATFANATAAVDPLKQGNIYVALSGDINGSVPVKIGTATVYMVFNGKRYKDILGTPSQVAGDYFYGQTYREGSTGLNPATDFGTLRINADGSGRICSQATISNTCGFVVTIAADDPANPRVLKFTSGAPQNLLGYALIKSTAGKLSGTMDASFGSTTKFTGAYYFAQMTGTFAASAITGEWNAVSTDPNSASRTAVVGYVRHSAATASTTNYTNHEKFGGGDCSASSTAYNGQGTTQNASSFPGVGLLTRTNLSVAASYVVPLSPDLFVKAQPSSSGTGNGTVSIHRKYTVGAGQTNPNPC
jgi:hypothetical protein